jgi:hypothetical protein
MGLFTSREYEPNEEFEDRDILKIHEAEKIKEYKERLKLKIPIICYILLWSLALLLLNGLVYLDKFIESAKINSYTEYQKSFDPKQYETRQAKKDGVLIFNEKGEPVMETVELKETVYQDPNNRYSNRVCILDLKSYDKTVISSIAILIIIYESLLTLLISTILYYNKKSFKGISSIIFGMLIIFLVVNGLITFFTSSILVKKIFTDKQLNPIKLQEPPFSDIKEKKTFNCLNFSNEKILGYDSFDVFKVALKASWYCLTVSIIVLVIIPYLPNVKIFDF